jgi:hypothetical protein
MANLNSTETLDLLYSTYGGSVTGGDESQTPRVIGGLDSVKDYANTIMSHAKSKLIRDIARDMKAKFRIEGKGASKVTINPDADLDTLVKQLKQAIPNPGGNGRVFSSKLGTQKKACGVLAKIINNRFGFKAGSGIIDESADADEICEKVSEVMYTLFTGMHGEFLAVRSDTERLLKNLHHLHTILDRNYKHLMDKMSTADPENIESETKLAREGHKSILKEMKRQQTMLENMMNVVVTPQDKAMAQLLKETKEYKRLVNDIKKLPGTGKFGEKLSYVLSGIGTTAQMASAVDKALRTISMSASEYGRQKNLKDLEESVFDKLQSNLHGSSGEELRQYMKAARTLFKYEYKRPDIVKELGRTGSAEDQDVDGGASRIQGGLRVDKRVKRRQDLKKALVTAFNKRLNIHLENINRSVKAIAEGTGTSVPITDNLRKFTKRLELIPNLEKRHIYYALTGYYRDAASKAERESFLSNVKSLTDVLEDMMKQREYSSNGSVRDLLREWKSLSKMVEDYADKFEKGFGDVGYKVSPSVHETGADEDDVDGGGSWSLISLAALKMAGKSDTEAEKIYQEQIKPILKQMQAAGTLGVSVTSKIAELVQSSTGEEVDEAALAKVEAAPEKTGGFLSRLLGGADDLDAGVEITRLAYTLEKAKETMRYYFRVADIRNNLKSIKDEQKVYGEDYEKVLGDAVARARDAVTKVMNVDLKALRDGDNVVGSAPNMQYAGLLAEIQARPDVNNVEQAKIVLRKMADFKERHYNVKINMLKCAEAIDLYMKHFTDGIVSNVDDIQKVETMLRGTDIISKWFTKRSGNLITCVFDSFPGYFEGHTPKYSNLPRNWDHKRMGDELHYYWRVQSLCRLTGKVQAASNLRNESKKLGSTSSDELKEDLYDAGGAWTGAGSWMAHADQQGLVGADDMNGAVASGLPGLPYLGVPAIKELAEADPAGDDKAHNWRSGTKVLELIQKAFENVSVLKNLIAAFVAIGSRFGGDELKGKTNMRPVHIYKCLIEYMSMGSLDVGLGNTKEHSSGAGFNEGPLYLPAGVAGVNNTIKVGDNIKSGVTGQGIAVLSNAGPDDLAGAPNIITRKEAYVAMRPAEGKLTGLLDIFSGGAGPDTDHIFTLTLKAMMAKILTVIGVYNMLNKPMDKQALGYNSYTRLTLGGVDLGVPDVIPEAFELYVRLPLLAEFYRGVFKFDDQSQNPNPVLSMVPEIDGTFRGIVELIFDKAKYVEYGTYSETDIKTIVTEVNKIYMKFKGSKSVVHDVVHAFIAEINRRYGILVREERKRYQDDLNKRYKDRYSSLNMEDRADYDILDEEEYGDSPPGPGPSDSYVQEGSIPGNVKDHKWTIRLDTHQRYINQLRSNIDQKFKDTWDANDNSIRTEDGVEHLKTLSFENLIKARTEELKYAKDKKSQFRVVMQSINGLGEFSMNAQERSIILFHETVATGLNTLYGLYRVVEKFRQEMFKMGACVDGIREFARDNAAGPAAGLLNAYQLKFNDPAVYDQGLTFLNGADVVVWMNSQGAPNIINLDDINQHLANGNDAQHKEPMERFGLNSQKMYTKFIELLYGHCTSLDDLVECQLEAIDHPDMNDRNPNNWLKDSEKRWKLTDELKPKSLAIALDHSKLMDLVEREMNFLRQTIDKFRGLIPKKVIDCYEALKDSNGNDQEGSYYWLEKKFVFETLTGKVEKWEDKHLARVNDQARKIAEYLFKPYQFNARGFAGLAPGAQPAGGNWYGNQHVAELNPAGVPIGAATATSLGYSQNNYYGSISHLTSFNIYAHRVGNSVAAFASGNGLQKLLFEPPNNAGGRPILPEFVTGGAAHHPYPLINSNNGALSANDRLRSIMVMFNKLLGAYLHQFFDQQSEKMYLGIIDKFANGAFSEFVMGANKQFVDHAAGAGAAFALPNGEDIKYVLFSSLSGMLRNLLNGKVRGKTYKHWLETDLAEIPLFMKENYKSNMPVFNKLFSFLEQKARLIKHFVNASHVRRETAVGGHVFSTEVEFKKRMNNVLDQVMLGCASLKTCISEVMEEMADAPLFLETHKDSIKEYEAANGSKPLMPLSSVLQYMRDRHDNVDQRSAHFVVGGPQNRTGDKTMPRFNMGSTEFKMLYGTRGILAANGDLGLDKVPGMKDILKKHNEATEAEYHCDEKNIADHVSNTLMAARYLINNSHYKSLLSTLNENYAPVAVPLVASTTIQYWATNAANLNGAANMGIAGPALPPGLGDASTLFNHMREPLQRKNPNVANISIDGLVHSLRHNMLPVVQITSDTNQRTSRQSLVRVVEEVDKTIVRGTRDQIRTLNIIDMNVVPINIHALMREIPLVNLYNYAYTFDSMICNIFGVDQELRNYIGAPGAPPGMVPPPPPGTGSWSGPGSISATLDKYPRHERARKVLGWMTIHPYGPISWDEYQDHFSRIARGAIGIDGLGRPKFLGDQLYNKALFGEVYSDTGMYDESGPAVAHGRELGGPPDQNAGLDNYLQALIQLIDGAAGLGLGVGVAAALAGAYVANANNPPGLAPFAAGGLAAAEGPRLLGFIRRVHVRAFNAAELVKDSPWPAVTEDMLNTFHKQYKDLVRDSQPGDRGMAPQQARRRTDSKLHYLHQTKDGKSKVIAVEVGEYKHYLQKLGKMRFDTFYCRSLVWMTNLQRALRLKLRRDLHWYNSKIVRDNAVMAPSITELYGNDTALYNDHFYRN